MLVFAYVLNADLATNQVEITKSGYGDNNEMIERDMSRVSKVKPKGHYRSILGIVFTLIVTSYLFNFFAEFYIYLVGETVSNASKLLSSVVCLLLCSTIVMSLNSIYWRLQPKNIGICIACGLFIMLYLIGPGRYAPATIYRTFISFPYNLNMFMTIALPTLLGMLVQRLKYYS